MSARLLFFIQIQRVPFYLKMSPKSEMSLARLLSKRLRRSPNVWALLFLKSLPAHDILRTQKQSHRYHVPDIENRQANCNDLFSKHGAYTLDQLLENWSLHQVSNQLPYKQMENVPPAGLRSITMSLLCRGLDFDHLLIFYFDQKVTPTERIFFFLFSPRNSQNTTTRHTCFWPTVRDKRVDGCERT